MEEYLGKKYALKTSDNFEEYLVFIEKNYFQRKAALSLSQENWLTQDATGAYTFHFHSPFVSASTTFISGEETDETRPDGVKVRALITIEDNKMIHIQTEENGRVSKHTRVFSPESMTSEIGAAFEALKAHFRQRYFESPEYVPSARSRRGYCEVRGLLAAPL